MSERNDGGPAFGGAYDLVMIDQTAGNPAQKIERRVPGMSLRDYFAAKAMQGMVVRIGKHDTDLIAHDAYLMADAMLAARSK